MPPELAHFHSPSYQHALTAYNLAHEIHGDAILFDHAQAARSNRQLWRDYPELRGQYWQIGSSGQGDFWLLRRDGNICWYDHDLGEITPAAIVDFAITFDQFLALSASLAQIERTLDTNEHYFAAPAHRQAALCAKLNRAGVVFRFGVWQAPAHSDPEATHAAALAALFAQILQADHDAQAERIAQYHAERLAAARNDTERAKIRRAAAQNPLPPLSFHPQAARSAPLDTRFIQPAASLRPGRDYAQAVRPRSHTAAQAEFDPQNWFVRLYRAFNEPPYGLGSLPEANRRVLWADFCEQTGLLPEANISVRDWVRHNSYNHNGRAQYSRHPLSNYFDAGLEWWGIWCLTIHHPRRQTVAALAASATD